MIKKIFLCSTVLSSVLLVSSCDPTPVPQYVAQQVTCSFMGDDVTFVPVYNVSYSTQISFNYKGAIVTLSPPKACKVSLAPAYPTVKFQYNSVTTLNELVPVAPEPQSN